MGILDYRFRSSIPSLQIPLSNASSAASRLPSHGSGPGRLAIPSLYDSCIRYSTPVYPDALQTRGSAPRILQNSWGRPPGLDGVGINRRGGANARVVTGRHTHAP